MPQNKSIYRKYITELSDKNECIFCKETFCKNISRAKHHFVTKCQKLPSRIEAIIRGHQKEGIFYSIVNYCYLITEPNTPPIDVNTDQRPSSSMSSSSTTSSKTIEELFKKSEDTQKDLERGLARAVFSQGWSLNCVNNNEFRDFLTQMRPSFKIPSRYCLSNQLLDKEYTNVSKPNTRQYDVQYLRIRKFFFLKIMEINEQEIRSSYGLTIIIDGWTNIRNEAIIDVILCTPKPIFFKSLCTGVTPHSSLELMGYIKPVIEQFGE